MVYTLGDEDTNIPNKQQLHVVTSKLKYAVATLTMNYCDSKNRNALVV